MLHYWVKYFFFALNSTFEIHASGNDIIYCDTFYFLTTLPGPPPLCPPATPPPSPHRVNQLKNPPPLELMVCPQYLNTHNQPANIIEALVVKFWIFREVPRVVMHNTFYDWI